MRMLTCIGIGAGAMYFLDPQLGRRRRALVRDKFNRLLHELEQAGDVLQRDFSNRVQGVEAVLQAGLHPQPADDETIGARVRAKLGRLCSHPGAIEVAVHGGQVTLSGPILAREVEQTVNAIALVPGVERVHNELEVHHRADISALQGGRPRPGMRPDLLQENWSPTTRALVGGGAAAMLFYGSLRRSPRACLLGTVGLAMLARSASNASTPQAYQSMQSRVTPTAQRGEQAENATEKHAEASSKRPTSAAGKPESTSSQDAPQSKSGRGKSKVEHR